MGFFDSSLLAFPTMPLFFDLEEFQLRGDGFSVDALLESVTFCVEFRRLIVALLVAEVAANPEAEA
jgi:hypothetical protein